MPNGERDGLDAQTVRECIEGQICPWCRKGPFQIVASHVRRAHGIDRFRLRELADLPWTAVITDPDYHRRKSEHMKAIGHHPPPPTAELAANRGLSPAGKRIRDAALRAGQSWKGTPAQVAASAESGRRRGEQLRKPRRACAICGRQVPYRPGNAKNKTCGDPECLTAHRSNLTREQRARAASKRTPT